MASGCAANSQSPSTLDKYEELVLVVVGNHSQGVVVVD